MQEVEEAKRRRSRRRRRSSARGDGKGCIYPATVYTGATEDGPRWKSAAFRGTGQENWLTTFRTGVELPIPNLSPVPGPQPEAVFTDIYAGRTWRIVLIVLAIYPFFPIRTPSEHEGSKIAFGTYVLNKTERHELFLVPRVCKIVDDQGLIFRGLPMSSWKSERCYFNFWKFSYN